MRIAKPLLLTTTPIGVAIGVYEGFRLTHGLVFLMIAMLLMVTAAFAMLIQTIRCEQAAEAASVWSPGSTQSSGEP